MKSYKEKTKVKIWLNGKAGEYEVEQELIDMPLGKLLNIYCELKSRNWLVKMFKQSYRDEFLLEDIESALDTMKFTMHYKYIKAKLKNKQ